LGSETDNGTDNGSAGIILIKNSFNVAAKTEFNLKGNAKLAFVPAVTEDDAVVDGVLTAEIEGSIFWVAGATEALDGPVEHKFGGEGRVQTSAAAEPVVVAEAVIAEREYDTLLEIPIVAGGGEDEEDEEPEEGDGWDYDEDGDWPSGTVNSITLNNSTLKMTQVGETAQLTVTFDPDSMKDTGIIWSSSKPAVATVTGSGLVKAVALGQTTIIAKTVVSGKTATCTVDVNAGLVAGLYENDDTEPKDLTDTNGNNLLEKSFAWIKANSTAEYSYTIVLDEDISVATGFTIGSGAGTNSSTGDAANNKNLTITLKGLGEVRTITKTAVGALFTVYGNASDDVTELVLDENITLSGYAGNNAFLVVLGNGVGANMKPGKLIMKNGSLITGNGSSSNTGGGVSVIATSTFIMEGGTISGNKSASGGGVYANTGGVFTMNGGVIEDNTATAAGGGVNAGMLESTSPVAGVYPAAPFTMNSGTIRNNHNTNTSTGTTFGGGVYTVNFIMTNGEISGNDALCGGGVGIGSNVNAVFKMTGGTIAGNRARGRGAAVYRVQLGTFEKTGGTIYGSAGDYANKKADGVTTALYSIEMWKTTSARDHYFDDEAGPDVKLKHSRTNALTGMTKEGDWK
jgi:hypothetical protein